MIRGLQGSSIYLKKIKENSKAQKFFLKKFWFDSKVRSFQFEISKIYFSV